MLDIEISVMIEMVHAVGSTRMKGSKTYKDIQSPEQREDSGNQSLGKEKDDVCSSSQDFIGRDRHPNRTNKPIYLQTKLSLRWGNKLQS